MFRHISRRAFTLIELLVVVAIIALLMSILLPSIQAAREQAKQVKCLANLKGIGDVMNMYFNDWKEQFPFERHEWPTGNTSWVMSAFYYGGHPGGPGATEWNANHRYAFYDKPFNRYMYSGLRRDVEKGWETSTPQFKEARKPFRNFACPSDVGAQAFSDENIQVQVEPAHVQHGTSYDINWHFVWWWAAGKAYGNRPAPDQNPYLKTANEFLRVQRRHYASRFVILYEDRFDLLQAGRLSGLGWHKQWNRHSFLFLDGHAANVNANPAKDGAWGPNWKTSALQWWRNPDDLDYQFRELGPHRR